jgi:flagellar biosynthetic protein FlhB
MANPDDQDRHLPASQRKLNKAREEGQVVRSRDLGHFAALAAGVALITSFGPMLAAYLQQTLVKGLRFDLASVQTPGFMGARLQEMTWQMLWVVVPLGLAMSGVAIAGVFAVGGWNWTLKSLQPNFGKLDPLSGLTRLISKAQLVDTLKACVLAIVVGTIGAFYLKTHVDSLGGLLGMPLPAAIAHGAQTLLGGLMLMLLALAAFAMVDVPLQKFQHAQRLRMSHQERKQEQRETDGNGEVKARVRARMRELATRRMMAAVPTADLVVMNPTHYAVALKYDDGGMAAPKVVAKGADLIALAIRDLAKGSKVPVLQAPVLARALYAHAELDREIPAVLFAAVAQVLAYVYQLRAALSGRAPMPGDLPELNVPPELDPHQQTRPT